LLKPRLANWRKYVVLSDVLGHLPLLIEVTGNRDIYYNTLL